jgi:hypothetical protein
LGAYAYLWGFEPNKVGIPHIHPFLPVALVLEFVEAKQFLKGISVFFFRLLSRIAKG